MDKKLVLLDAGMFCVGMKIKAKIYYLHKGNYVLLCKDVTFHQSLIDKLYRIAEENDGVYIEEESYEEVWDESLKNYSIHSADYIAMYQKIREDYDKILTKTAIFLSDVTATGKINFKEARNIENNIANELRSMDHSMVLRCINMIGEADNYLYTHCVNVATLNGFIGQWMKLPEQDIKKLIKIGLLHDLGKLKIPYNILNKPGKLTEAEFIEVKRHPMLTYDMLLDSGEIDYAILLGVRHHHEKPNGNGYPDSLVQQDISLFARITAVSDVYDAMVSKRCYKDACSPFDILAQFKASQFSDLDLEVVKIFLENITFLFVGMKVKLSNGECGEIVFVPPMDMANPVVKVGNRVMTTNKYCKCMAIDMDFLSM